MKDAKIVTFKIANVEDLGEKEVLYQVALNKEALKLLKKVLRDEEIRIAFAKVRKMYKDAQVKKPRWCSCKENLFIRSNRVHTAKCLSKHEEGR